MPSWFLALALLDHLKSRHSCHSCLCVSACPKVPFFRNFRETFGRKNRGIHLCLSVIYFGWRSPTVYEAANHDAWLPRSPVLTRPHKLTTSKSKAETPWNTCRAHANTSCHAAAKNPGFCAKSLRTGCRLAATMWDIVRPRTSMPTMWSLQVFLDRWVWSLSVVVPVNFRVRAIWRTAVAGRKLEPALVWFRGFCGQICVEETFCSLPVIFNEVVSFVLTYPLPNGFEQSQAVGMLEVCLVSKDAAYTMFERLSSASDCVTVAAMVL